MFKQIKSEKVEVTEIKEKRTFEYYIDGVRHEYSLVASVEFWDDEQVALSFVDEQIKKAAQQVR